MNRLLYLRKEVGMRRPICSPRLQNVLDIAQGVVAHCRLEPELVRRFEETLSLDIQRGSVDCGMGLCGQRGSRLARASEQITCTDCLRLLGRLR